ncbi:aquaporin-like protein [Periconia macrospinosa]|uniref:Aquaporin-like protein n=1 Tax=Periconia macrospinosa TaxID=97972 RepID=A0A2V1EGK9_9PLEO|nr:aquaporin-like protein [Periconia macrospinosa]
MTGTLYAKTLPGAQTDYQTSAWAWGLSVMAGIYISGGVSGAHMSPWVSICLAVFRGFPWKMVPVYSIAQVLGGLCAGVLAWAVYRDGIMNVDPELTQAKTGVAFYSFPSPYVSLATAFWNSFLSAAMYICIAFGVGDDTNTPPGSGMFNYGNRGMIC